MARNENKNEMQVLESDPCHRLSQELDQCYRRLIWREIESDPEARGSGQGFLRSSSSFGKKAAADIGLRKHSVAPFSMADGK